MNRITELPESSISPTYINNEIQRLKGIGLHVGSVSDGYHTFDELYEHRSLLFLQVAKGLWIEYMKSESVNQINNPFWITKQYSNGDQVQEGYFLAGLFSEPGRQITYHLQNKYWDKCEEFGALFYRHAPEWDGHTSADVLKRLAEL